LFNIAILVESLPNSTDFELLGIDIASDLRRKSASWVEQKNSEVFYLTLFSEYTAYQDCYQTPSKIIDKIYNKNKSHKDNLENTVLVLYFIYAIKDPQIENIKYCSICESFVKKLKKKVITIDTLQEKLYRSECSNYIKNFTSLRFINWIFS